MKNKPYQFESNYKYLKHKKDMFSKNVGTSIVGFLGLAGFCGGIESDNNGLIIMGCGALSVFGLHAKKSFDTLKTLTNAIEKRFDNNLFAMKYSLEQEKVIFNSYVDGIILGLGMDLSINGAMIQNQPMMVLGFFVIAKGVKRTYDNLNQSKKLSDIEHKILREFSYKNQNSRG